MMQSVAINPILIRKYNQPVPRYTSYPTVPYWNDHMEAEAWQPLFTRRFHERLNAACGNPVIVRLLSLVDAFRPGWT